MFHCLDDDGNPMTLLDLCGLSVEEASEHLVALREEMLADPERWARRDGDREWPGVRVVIEWEGDQTGYKKKHPLENPREDTYPGLHPDFGLMTCWFCCIADHDGPYYGVRRIMYVVRPNPDFKRRKLRLVG